MTRHCYSEYRLYSVIKDAVVSRISIADARGGEFWMEIPGEGKGYREARAKALEDIQEAIEKGLPPGQVDPTKLTSSTSVVGETKRALQMTGIAKPAVKPTDSTQRPLAVDVGAANHRILKEAMRLKAAKRQEDMTRRSAQARRDKYADRNRLVQQLRAEGLSTRMICKHSDIVRMNGDQPMKPKQVCRIAPSRTTLKKNIRAT